ncbi:hypothetical protein LOAG_11710 [Loa loa]|uniref:Integrase catalytic domain-containing protein n=1 Tax=Loa loa TaxID=7209 RepID=A0A1I7VR16_LOALO|nr:hypothetical protein LOAG_11710 [Loa loa]EFO16792.1 hypothetical protein LOAG_11710 [Loa loa]
MQQPDSSVNSYHQYAKQESTEDNTISIPQITDTIQEFSSNVEQFEMTSENLATSGHYNNASRKSIKDDMTEAMRQIKLGDDPSIIAAISKTAFYNLSTSTVTLTPVTTTTAKIISGISTATTTGKYKKCKFKAYIKTSPDTFTELLKFLAESMNVVDFPNATKTDVISNSNTIDKMLSFGKSAYSKMSIIREFPTPSNFKTTNLQYAESNEESDTNQIVMTSTEFATNLQNSRITTFLAPNPTSVSSQLIQKDMVAIDKETETEAENDESKDEKDDYEYEDILYISPPVTITTTTTTTTSPTITTTTTTTTTARSISVPEFTPLSQSHHHHHHRHQYEHYDRQSPIIVTALFDIGRGKWPRYTRTYEQYMNYLKHLLKLRNCLVIYTDSRGAEFVRQMRNTHNTQIFEMSMRDLPLYRYREEIEGIIRREQEDWRFGPKTRYHPEANSADYNIIVNSKPYFLYNATQNTRFRASDRIFAWIDAGYGHGREGIIPKYCHWRPDLRRDRITIIKMTPTHDKVSRYSITDLYRVDWVVLSGGFIAGDSHTINRFYRFYQKSFMELLDSGRIDDDQTVLTLMLKHYANLFNPISSNGDWYAIFRLFPCHDKQ